MRSIHNLFYYEKIHTNTDGTTSYSYFPKVKAERIYHNILNKLKNQEIYHEDEDGCGDDIETIPDDSSVTSSKSSSSQESTDTILTNIHMIDSSPDSQYSESESHLIEYDIQNKSTLPENQANFKHINVFINGNKKRTRNDAKRLDKLDLLSRLVIEVDRYGQPVKKKRKTDY